jgi:hypothetical protein
MQKRALTKTCDFHVQIGPLECIPGTNLDDCEGKEPGAKYTVVHLAGLDVVPGTCVVGITGEEVCLGT